MVAAAQRSRTSPWSYQPTTQQISFMHCIQIAKRSAGLFDYVPRPPSDREHPSSHARNSAHNDRAQAIS